MASGSSGMVYKVLPPSQRGCKGRRNLEQTSHPLFLKDFKFPKNDPGDDGAKARHTKQPRGHRGQNNRGEESA